MSSPASYNINDVADWTYRGTTDFEFAGMSISAVPADKSSGLGGLLVISSPQSNTATGMYARVRWAGARICNACTAQAK